MFDGYKIIEIPHKHAIRMVIKHHYLHRQCPCSFSFGIFNEKDFMIGVITYGTPSSSTLRTGVCGKDEALNVIELNRLWIQDNTPKNTESFFISHTIKKIDKDIVISYADPSVGHIGTIYQATNWIYTGLSEKRTDWFIEGENNSVHSQTFFDQHKMSVSELRKKYGEKFKLVDRPRKHRYVYFNCHKRRKKELIKKLRYPILPYPKVNK